MSYGDYRQSTGDHVPLVGRPRGAAWRTLQADGVVWEGQVFLIGGETDLATRMIVTHRRVTFARGGVIVLDLAREWLRPAPILRRDGTVQLSITAPGSSYGVESETIALSMRDGHPAAGHVIAMLAGSGARRILPEAVPSSDYVRGLLPPLADTRRSHPSQNTAADPDLPERPLLPSRLDDELPFGSFEFPPRRPALPPLPDTAPDQPFVDRDPVVRQSAPPMSLTRDRAWNLEPIRQMVPRGTRHRRRGWIFRLGGLVVLLGFSALLGADRIPLPRGEQPVSDAPGPTATVRPVAQFILPTVAAGVPSTVIAGSTSFDLGIGSQAQLAPTPSGQAAPAAQATTEPTAEQAAADPPTTPEPAAAETTAAVAEPATTAIPADETATAAPSPAAATDDALRPTVDLARRGATLPEYGLAAPNEGEWLVITLTLINESDTETELAMTDFVLEADGAEIAVDRRSAVVASILRLQGAPDDIADTVRLDPGESITLPLVFQVPSTAVDLALRRGESRIDLTPSLAAPGSQITSSRGFAAARPTAITSPTLDRLLGRD